MRNDNLKSRIQKSRGTLSLIVLIFGSLAVVILTGFIIWADANLRIARRSYNMAQAFRIAEAGIDYYRWHLAHAPVDYQDGTGMPGPYTHDYYDKAGETIGQFILDITPPLVGSSVVTIESTGKVTSDTTIEKIIITKLAKPSFAKYAAVVNSDVRFGEGTEIFGLVHANGGFRFDGLAHNLVTSALPSYDDPDHGGPNEFGVHTHVSPKDPFPPNPVPVRPDIFIAGRQFPVPAVDFVGITQTLANIKSDAQADGFYRGSSGASGYDIVLKTNNTFDLYEVTSLVAPQGNCYNILNQSSWGSWSIATENLLGNYQIPASGLIFMEDDVWIRGQVNGTRATIASARFPDNPSTRSNIIINDDVLYSNYDGQDVLGFIAQNNISIGMVSKQDIRIEAALLAQNGWVGRFYYKSTGGSQGCGPHNTKGSITTYGMIGSNQRYGFRYTDGNGYQTRTFNYDSNLLYSPPPSFPLAADNYEQIFWSEIK